MSAYNVFLTVTDPDLLMAGDSPYADFDVTGIELYRWTTEALARAGVAGAGTLVTTFTLIAASATQTEAAGPWSFAYNDTDQETTSWYRYRFRDTTGAFTSEFSEPWKPRNADGAARTTPLRDIMWEVGKVLGEAAERGTATAGSTATVTCVLKFGSSLRANNYYKGHWLVVLEDAGGAAAAPEGQEALVASDVASTGVLTLDRTLTAAIASGDTVMTSAFMRPSEMISCINRAREGMKVLRRNDVATWPRTNAYPAPQGTRVITDIYEVLGVTDLGSESNIQAEAPLLFESWSNGSEVFVKVPDVGHPIVRVISEVSYRDFEGELSAMGDTTAAPIEWLRYAAAHECMKILTRDDPENLDFASIAASVEEDLRTATARYATRMPARRAKRLNQYLPGPARY